MIEEDLITKTNVLSILLIQSLWNDDLVGISCVNLISLYFLYRFLRWNFTKVESLFIFQLLTLDHICSTVCKRTSSIHKLELLCNPANYKRNHSIGCNSLYNGNSHFESSRVAFICSRLITNSDVINNSIKHDFIIFGRSEQRLMHFTSVIKSSPLKLECKIQKNWCTVTVVPTIEHHGGHPRTPANQRWDQAPGRSQRLPLG